MIKPSVLILGADAATEAAIRQVLRSLAVVSGETASLDRALEVYRIRPAQVVVVVVGQPAELALRQVAALNAAGARVVVVGPNKDPDLILGTMRAGAREFVLDGDEAELRRAIASQTPAADTAGAGELITVFPTRGGVGATTVAVNLGGALQRRGSRSCLLDFDLYLGDVLSFLDLPGTYSITDVIANRSRLDKELLETSVVRHASGLRVLAQSGKVEEAESVRAADAVAVLELLRRHYHHLVVDGIAGFDELSLAVLDASQHIVMVLTQDVPSVRSTKRCLELFRRLGYDDRKVKLVVNRFHRNSKITSDVIAEAVGLPVAHTLSNDFASAIEAINRGLMLESLAPRSALTRDIEALAPLFIATEGGGGERRGFLRGLWSRKASDGSNRAA
jgi:pilus assembly protein CpaE